MYDLIIQNVRIADGTGNPAYHARVAVSGGRIAAIGRTLTGAKEVLDGGGLTLAPGFIDAHSHHDLLLERERTCRHALEQGVTTIIGGMCGESPMPLSREHMEDGLRVCGEENASAESREARLDTGRYLDWIAGPMGANMAFLVGHGNLRAAVMGYENRRPTAAEQKRMEELLRQSIRAGAYGVSFGLIYPPGSYADREELTGLCRAAAEEGGLFTVHLRSENRALVEAVDEMLTVARDSGCKGIISHHKATGGPLCWNKTAATLSMMDRAAAEGLDIFCDQYPYTASATGLSTNIPGEMHALGVDALVEMLQSPAGMEALRPRILESKTPEEQFVYTMIGHSPSHPEYAGKMLNDLARELGVDPYDLQCDLLAEDRLSTGAIFHTMCEEDVERVMRWPRCMVGTDGAFDPGQKGAHPRTFATFPRVLGRYVREKGVLTLEDAVRKMTYLPAMVYDLPTKGLIREGMDADLVLFDPETIADRADYAHPDAPCVGLRWVMVAGQMAVWNGKATGVLAGKQLRYAGSGR